jgi:hypothetical protein
MLEPSYSAKYGSYLLIDFCKNMSHLQYDSPTLFPFTVSLGYAGEN